MKTYLPIAAVFLAVILSGVLSFHELAVLRDDNAIVSHGYEIQQQLQTLLSELKDAEASQRGYLYTNNAEYLRPYSDSRTAVDSTFYRLADLTKGDLRQRDELADVRVLLDKKLNEMNETITYQKSGDTAKARALVETNAGFELMNALRTAVGKLNTEQSLSFRDQQTKVRRSALWLTLSLAFTSLLVLVLLTLLSRALAIAMRARNAERIVKDDLQRSYESLDQILKSVAAGFIVLDRDAAITYINEAARSLLGKSEIKLIGRRIWDVFPDADGNKFPAQLREAVTTGKETVFENFYPKLSKWLEVHSYASAGGISIFLLDVSLRKQSETALRRAEQLAVTGRFAATVAHEINNPLEAVTNLIYLASRDSAASASVLKYLDLADKELERVAHMTKQTLGFYREPVAPTQFSLAELLDELLTLFDGRFKSKALAVTRDYEASVQLSAVRGEIRQVFANLLVNAIDASPHNGEMRIHIAMNGELASVQFIDNGPGVPEQDLEKIFEPFFTTKKDVGTGLGLWVARDLAAKHGGEIQVSRVANAGACFEVRLPGATIAETLSVQVGQ